MWRFRVYVSPNGNDELQRAIDGLSDECREQFLTRLRYLSETRKEDWHEPQARKLRGVEGIYEIRFSADKVKQRPLGFFGLGGGEFTIVIWAIHKQNVYKPPSAIKTADRRRKAIKGGEATTAPLQIGGEDFPPFE